MVHQSVISQYFFRKLIFYDDFIFRVFLLICSGRVGGNIFGRRRRRVEEG